MLTAGLVAALGFFSLLTFEIANIRTFGLFTGLGILSALLIELTFIPALRSYLPAPRPKLSEEGAAKPRVWDRLAHRLTQLVIERHRSTNARLRIIVTTPFHSNYVGHHQTVFQQQRCAHTGGEEPDIVPPHSIL